MKKKHKVKGAAHEQPDLQKILKGLFRNHPHKSYNAKQAIRKLKILNDRHSVQHALEVLEKKGSIRLFTEDKYRWSGETATASGPRRGHSTSSPKTVIGTVDLTRSGAAFIQVPDSQRDIFIPPKSVHTALQGDTVEVQVNFTRNGRPEGEVIRIVTRMTDHFVGTLHVTKRGGVVVPDKFNMPYDILIPREDLTDVKDGQKVVVRVTEWPGPGSRTRSLKGKLADSFQGSSANDIEMQAILVNNGFPLHFTDDVLSEATTLPAEIPAETIATRRDMRGTLTFTIDPEDAKDFDDALSFKILEDGNLEIGVHIADVTHYVQPGSALDREAYNRSTSVYLVDRVLPMLPERLSNELCSLRPNEDSLTFSAIFIMDQKGNIKDTWLGKTIIHSDHRMSYEQAQQTLETGEGDLAAPLRQLNDIAHRLRKERYANGAISFESEEVKFKLNEEGVPIEVFVKERKDAHLLIEDFMLLANKTVAQFIRKKSQGQEVPFVYRVHDLPDPDKLADFASFARELGFTMAMKTPRQIAESFNKLAEAARENENLRILEPIAIRTMAKAIYTTRNIGHYGLAFEDYTHFTSPIRRYSDVLVHRILEKNLSMDYRVDKADLESRCMHVSKQERRAMDAERESIRYKQIEYIQNHVGEVFEGQINGVMDRGVFVQLRGSYVEGMAPFSHFPEPYDVDNGRLKATGRYSGHVVKMGDTVHAQILFADLARRQIEMRIIFED